MNRRERRKAAKDLGITKHIRNISREKWYEELRDNVESGRRMQNEMKETRRIQEDQDEDALISKRIENMAMSLVMQKGIPFNNAIEEAKYIYETQIANKEK
jgi:hypothetical protein